MSTSELRRGPGWWMDLDGQWNPPESWPEASPPLPGWTRDSAGRWHAPTTADLDDAGIQDAAAPAKRPVPEGPPPIPDLPSIDEPKPPAPTLKKPTESSLRFAEAHAAPRPDEEAERNMRRATNAAIIAAVTATMLAAGIVVLLALL